MDYPVYLYKTLQPAGHHQRVLAALQGAFQLLPLQTDVIKWHKNFQGTTGVGCCQMLRLFLHHQIGEDIRVTVALMLHIKSS